jgi:excisionase family DNA binding protein
MEKNNTVPMLLPYEPGEFWTQLRQIIHEEIAMSQSSPEKGIQNVFGTSGLMNKPLYEIDEICRLFNVSRTTIDDWVKVGKLRKVKVRRRVYFLSYEVQRLFQ